ncbi:hypothetical protein RAAC3_TM7C00001G0711 [Candidatus Saccharibacteria bacterium RAAC3_TM7_1]|nr:hypothetical protein RAAC3_TM7C00001G0711 [Candidatus Saccharibacteria bacterium RAAC3_TM7_1]
MYNHGMKVNIDASTRTFIRFWLVPLGIFLAGLAIYSARTALVILGTAFFLALALNAPVSRLARYFPGNSRAASTAVAYILVVALLGAFIFLAVPPIIQQTAKFIQTVPSLVTTAQEQWHGLDRLITEYHLQSQVDQLTDSIKNSTSTWASSAGSSVVSGIGSFFSILTGTILVLVLSFLMLIEGPAWMRRIWGLYTDQKKMAFHKNVVHRMNAVVSGYVTGQLTVSGLGALAAGTMVFILSFFFNIPSNLAIPTAAITFVLSLIPMFGATIGGLLIASLLAFNDIGAAIVYVAFFVVYQQIENNYISPTIQSRRLELSALAILTSVAIGLYLFGIAGGVISIPIAGCIKVLIQTYLERNRTVADEPEHPVVKLVKKARNKAV